MGALLRKAKSISSLVWSVPTVFFSPPKSLYLSESCFFLICTMGEKDAVYGKHLPPTWRASQEGGKRRLSIGQTEPGRLASSPAMTTASFGELLLMLSWEAKHSFCPYSPEHTQLVGPADSSEIHAATSVNQSFLSSSVCGINWLSGRCSQRLCLQHHLRAWLWHDIHVVIKDTVTIYES